MPGPKKLIKKIKNPFSGNKGKEEKSQSTLQEAQDADTTTDTQTNLKTARRNSAGFWEISEEPQENVGAVGGVNPPAKNTTDTQTNLKTARRNSAGFWEISEEPQENVGAVGGVNPPPKPPRTFEHKFDPTYGKVNLTAIRQSSGVWERVMDNQGSLVEDLKDALAKRKQFATPLHEENLPEAQDEDNRLVDEDRQTDSESYIYDSSFDDSYDEDADDSYGGHDVPVQEEVGAPPSSVSEVSVKNSKTLMDKLKNPFSGNSAKGKKPQTTWYKTVDEDLPEVPDTHNTEGAPSSSKVDFMAKKNSAGVSKGFVNNSKKLMDKVKNKLLGNTGKEKESQAALYDTEPEAQYADITKPKLIAKRNSAGYWEIPEAPQDNIGAVGEDNAPAIPPKNFENDVDPLYSKVDLNAENNYSGVAEVSEETEENVVINNETKGSQYENVVINNEKKGSQYENVVVEHTTPQAPTRKVNNRPVPAPRPSKKKATEISAEDAAKQKIVNDLHQQYENLLKDKDKPKSITEKKTAVENSDLTQKVAKEYAMEIERHQQENEASTSDIDYDNSPNEASTSDIDYDNSPPDYAADGDLLEYERSENLDFNFVKDFSDAS